MPAPLLGAASAYAPFRNEQRPVVIERKRSRHRRHPPSADSTFASQRPIDDRERSQSFPALDEVQAGGLTRER
jgi:hypothetical protein